MQDLDLNLIRVAHTLLTEQSVTRAAERLYLSVPATSRALDRCRRVFGDELLVRRGRGVVITARGEELLARLTPVIDGLQALMSDTSAFSPINLRRRFVICANEAVIAALGGPLIARVSAEAPHVEVRFAAETPDDVAALSNGDAAIAIGSYGDLTNEFADQHLADETMVGVLRGNHPLSSKRMTIARFAALDHVVVSRRGQARGPIDQQLEAQGRHRRIAAVVPTFAAALCMCLQTDATTLAPRRLALLFGEAAGLEIFEPPFELPTIDVRAVWHRRFSADRGHAWLRAKILETAGFLDRM
jgi:DNA-binding transcriptional LysR family regulator